MSQPRSGSGLSRAAHMRVDLGQPSTIRANVTPPLRQPGGILTPSTTINIDTHSSGTAVHQQIRDLEEKNRALQSRVSEYQTRISELEGELEDEKRKSSVMDEMGSSEKKKSLLGRKSKGFAFTVLPYIIASPAALLSVDLPTDFTSQHSCPCPSNTNPKDLEEAERKAIVWEVQQFLPPGVTPSTQIYKDLRTDASTFRSSFQNLLRTNAATLLAHYPELNGADFSQIKSSDPTEHPKAEELLNLLDFDNFRKKKYKTFPRLLNSREPGPLFATMLRDPIIQYIITMVLFGRNKIHEKGPYSKTEKTNAGAWGVQEITPGMVAMAAIGARWLVSQDLEFRRQGPTTSIDYFSEFMEIKLVLVENSDNPSIKEIFSSLNFKILGIKPPIPTLIESGNRAGGVEDDSGQNAQLPTDEDEELAELHRALRQQREEAVRSALDQEERGHQTQEDLHPANDDTNNETHALDSPHSPNPFLDASNNTVRGLGTDNSAGIVDPSLQHPAITPTTGTRISPDIPASSPVSPIPFHTLVGSIAPVNSAPPAPPVPVVGAAPNPLPASNTASEKRTSTQKRKRQDVDYNEDESEEDEDEDEENEKKRTKPNPKTAKQKPVTTYSVEQVQEIRERMKLQRELQAAQEKVKKAEQAAARAQKAAQKAAEKAAALGMDTIDEAPAARKGVAAGKRGKPRGGKTRGS